MMMRAARIESGVVVDLWEVPALDCYGDLYQLVAATDEVVMGATWDGTRFRPPPPPQKPLDEVKADLVGVVQRHLDATARARGYDGIVSLATYAASTNQAFAAEGRAGADWRDAVWLYCHGVLTAVQAGARPIPAADTLVAELPPMVWPT